MHNAVNKRHRTAGRLNKEAVSNRGQDTLKLERESAFSRTCDEGELRGGDLRQNTYLLREKINLEIDWVFAMGK